MLRLLVTLLILGFVFHAEADSPQERVWRDFVFYGNGVKYETESVQDEIAEKYDLPKKPGIVILATSSEKNGRYRRQHRIVDGINHETNMFLSVIANSEKKITSTGSYHTDTKTAKKLLKGDAFRLIVINRRGSLGHDCSCVLNKAKLLRAIE